MQAHESKAEVIRLCKRHLARCCSELETNNCPRVYLEIVRRNFNHLHADLISEIFQP